MIGCSNRTGTVKSLSLTIVTTALLLVAPLCRAQGPDDKTVERLEAEREKLARRLAEIDAELAKLKSVRYRLPVQDPSRMKSSAARWGLAAPVVGDFSDPNALVYDEAYMDKYVAWAVDSPINCGSATYWITTSDKAIRIDGGLDEAYLG